MGTKENPTRIGSFESYLFPLGWTLENLRVATP